MMRIILCEGETDAILIGYYLCNTVGWEFNKKPKQFKLQFSPQDNKCFLPYRKGREELFICAVGGKDNFKNFFETYLYDAIWHSHNAETEFSISIVTDRDNLSVEEVEDSIREQFSLIKRLKNNSWEKTEFENTLGEYSIINSLLITIPKDKEGALENLLMDALSENTYDATLVEACKQFVVDADDKINKYVSSDRLKIKAQLGVVLSVMNPDRAFNLFVEYINSVPWETSQILRECFGKLLEI